MYFKRFICIQSTVYTVLNVWIKWLNGPMLLPSPPTAFLNGSALPIADLPRPLVNLGEAVRRARSRKGLTQEELAEAAGVHRNYIGDVERGETNVGFLNLLKLAEGLGMSLEELISRYEAERRFSDEFEE